MSISSVEAMELEEDVSLLEEVAEDNEKMAKLKHVACTGSTSTYEWTDLRSIVHSRMLEIINRYIEQVKPKQSTQPPETSDLPATPLHTSSATDNSTLNDVENFINEIKREEQNLSKMVHDMYEPPFTIQRICELLYEPTRYYDKGDKFVRAIEKNLRVISPHEEPSEPKKTSCEPTNISDAPSNTPDQETTNEIDIQTSPSSPQTRVDLTDNK